VVIPQYLKILVRCLTSMLRIDNTIERLLSSTGCRPIIALVRVMKFSREEELVANSLKILRYSIKDEMVSTHSFNSNKSVNYFVEPLETNA
jgi:hypothetical protein